MTMSTPADLARDAGAGSEKAMKLLLRSIAPKIAGTVRAVLGARHPDSDDAIQLALIGFVDALPAYRGDCDPSGYARVIATRAAIAMKKRQRASDSRRAADAEPDAMAAPAPSPSERASDDERRGRLAALVSDLPDEQAEPLYCKALLGWSLEEIATKTGAPVNTVRSRIRLAKERLRSRIESDPQLAELFDRAA
jgi:RNA polymerase sigma-70 factor (ECF subfamily)